MSLKFRLNLFLSALFILVICLASLALLRNARENAGDEPEAAHRLAAALLEDLSGPQSPPVISTAAAANLSTLRHLRLAVSDRGMSELPGGPPRAPSWFEGLFSWPEIQPVRLQIENRAPARLHATPLDEIGEVWDDAKAAGAYALALLVLLNAGGWLILRRELQPLEEVSRALAEVKKGELSVRLPSFKLPEVAALADGFNRMTEALAQSRETNRKLTRTLIGVQEEERKQLARELHDEFGQHLTAARAEASAMERESGASDRVRASAKAIEASCTRMHKQLRGMLERLRPEALDALGLEEALLDLVCDFRERFPRTEWGFSADLPDKLAQDLEIAIYRCVQESFTNVARHANASRVNASVALDDDALLISVDDDGAGFDPQTVTMGWGLTGMRERIEGLGGNLRVVAGDQGCGTTVHATLPTQDSTWKKSKYC